jgi:hypothetical protein
MLIDVVAVHMVQMPVMQEVNVAIVADGRMTAIGSVDVCMVAVFRIGASCHHQSPAICSLLEVLQRILHRIASCRQRLTPSDPFIQLQCTSSDAR